MNLDNDKDYFLHDFDSSKEGADPQPERTPRPGETVDFTPPPTADAPAPSAPEKKRGGSGCLRAGVWFIVFLLLILGAAFYIRYMIPYATDSLVTGYVTSVEKRGIFFKTFECEMISQTALEDSTRIYSRDVTVSIPSDSLARAIQARQGSGRPVTLKVEKFYGTLPWRGASTTVAVGIDDSREK